MTAPYRVNLDMATNEDLRQTFKLTDSLDAPVDLGGATLAMVLEPLDGGGGLELSTANARIVVLDAAAGEFELRVPAADMALVVPGVYRHDLLLRRDGRTHRIFEGTLTLVDGVTP